MYVYICIHVCLCVCVCIQRAALQLEGSIMKFRKTYADPLKLNVRQSIPSAGVNICVDAQLCEQRLF